MAKKFGSRISKRDRVKKDITTHLDQSIFKMNDEKLLRGAQLDNVDLSKITVRKQVRTKFNDDSIKELAENIRENGLIQPLVIHREGNKYVLICGERRFRAMSTIDDMKQAPCFILENKTPEELMAIQFSENSAREQLHYIDQADSIKGYQQLTGASERKIQAALGISKSEVHRCLLIAALPKAVKEAAKIHNIEKYVLLEWKQLATGKLKNDTKKMIISGEITKRSQFKKIAGPSSNIYKAGSKKVSKNVTKNITKKSSEAEALIQAMQERTQDMKLDRKTKNMLKKLMQESISDL